MISSRTPSVVAIPASALQTTTRQSHLPRNEPHRIACSRPSAACGVIAMSGYVATRARLLLPKSGICWYCQRPEACMTKNTSISLGDHFGSFVDRQLAEGRYGTASEVVRAGLRLLEEHEIRLTALRAALIEGEQSGPSQPFDFDRFLEGKRNRQTG